MFSEVFFDALKPTGLPTRNPKPELMSTVPLYPKGRVRVRVRAGRVGVSRVRAGRATLRDVVVGRRRGVLSVRSEEMFSWVLLSLQIVSLLSNERSELSSVLSRKKERKQTIRKKYFISSQPQPRHSRA